MLIDRLGSEVYLCSVVFRSTSVAGNALDGNPADEQERGMVRELRSAAVEWFGPKGADVPIKILHGDPGERICEFAEFADCSLIVLGPRPKASVAHRLRGSVSRYVLANTRRSVWVLGD